MAAAHLQCQAGRIPRVPALPRLKAGVVVISLAAHVQASVTTEGADARLVVRARKAAARQNATTRVSSGRIHHARLPLTRVLGAPVAWIRTVVEQKQAARHRSLRNGEGTEKSGIFAKQ